MSSSNFKVAYTLDEANDVKRALTERFDKLTSKPVHEMTDDEKHEAGRIETMLRRDF